MCTVVIEVPPSLDTAPRGVRLLAVRDEEPSRPWDPPGEWWPREHPGVIGVRDRQANGAWLAAHPAEQRLAVIVNRAPAAGSGRPQGPVTDLRSRGHIVLDAVVGIRPVDPPGTASFTLVTVEPTGATVTSWDGTQLRTQLLTPGIHMLAHHEVDDITHTPRIAAWLPDFRALTGLGAQWRDEWIALLGRTAQLPNSDDRAIIRDNTPHGYPTQSLLACLAEVGPQGMHLDTAVLTAAGTWSGERFERSI